MRSADWIPAMRDASVYLEKAYGALERTWERLGSPDHSEMDVDVDRSMWMIGLVQHVVDEALSDLEAEDEIRPES